MFGRLLSILVKYNKLTIYLLLLLVSGINHKPNVVICCWLTRGPRKVQQTQHYRDTLYMVYTLNNTYICVQVVVSLFSLVR